jgi:4-carboxymuconolactone decarboxylase
MLALFGERGVIDLTGLCGYYGLLAMVMNVARTPVPESGNGLRALVGCE